MARRTGRTAATAPRSDSPRGPSPTAAAAPLSPARPPAAVGVVQWQRVGWTGARQAVLLAARPGAQN
ncbi:MAG: hypothetical protein VW709_21995, partial [Rickettsiales bacterium]